MPFLRRPAALLLATTILRVVPAHADVPDVGPQRLLHAERTADPATLDEHLTPTASSVYRSRDPTYDLVWGGVDNIEAGATLVIGATSLVFDSASLWLHGSRFDNLGTRALNLLALQFYLGGLTFGTFAHEFFGHFGHGIEAGLDPTLGFRFPAFGGSTQFRTTYRTPALARQENASSGPEVTETIAYEATRAMYSGHPVGSYEGLYIVGGHLVDAFFYDRSDLVPFLHDPTSYFAAKYDPKNPVSNDPVAWALALTERYGFYKSLVPTNATWVYVPTNPNQYLNAFILDQGRRVTLAYVLQLFDPTMLNGVYGLTRYLVTGDPFFRPVMLGNSWLRVASSIRANLGYLGAESYVDLFVVAGNLAPFSVYYRTGGNLYDSLRGSGIEVRDVHLSERVELAGQVDGWYDGLAHSLGGNVEEKVTYRLARNLGIIEALGYKTVGGLMGKPVDAGPYGYVGLRVIFPEARAWAPLTSNP